VIIVASVSCIYGIGAAEAYYDMVAHLEVGDQARPRPDCCAAGRDAVRAQRHRLPPRHLPRARRRGRGLPHAYEDETAVRIEFFGDEVEAIREIDALRGVPRGTMQRVAIFPASHYVVGPRLQIA
jgi:excinuclease ABC subunit B